MSKVDVDLSRATRLLQPGCLALVTARHRDKQNVMAAAWVTPVSSDPPMVALAIYPGRYTHELIDRSGAFTLNIPPRPLVETVNQIADVSGQDVDKFVRFKLDVYEGKEVGAPLIARCIGHLECGVVDRFQTGNHTLYIGEIVAASAEESAFDGEHWTLADEAVKPLHHLGASKYAVLDKPIEISSRSSP